MPHIAHEKAQSQQQWPSREWGNFTCWLSTAQLEEERCYFCSWITDRKAASVCFSCHSQHPLSTTGGKLAVITAHCLWLDLATFSPFCSGLCATIVRVWFPLPTVRLCHRFCSYLWIELLAAAKVWKAEGKVVSRSRRCFFCWWCCSVAVFILLTNNLCHSFYQQLFFSGKNMTITKKTLMHEDKNYDEKY